jgi:acyl-CoA dehydrogenase
MSDMRAILEDTVTRLFTQRVTQDLLGSAESGTWPAALWRAVEDNGLARSHVPEALGGAGGGWGEAFVILRAAGRHAVPLPLAETMLAAWLLAAAGIEAPEGPLTVLPDPAPEGALAGDRLTLRAGRVPWGSAAAHAVFVTPRGGRTHVGLVATDGAAKTRGENIAREPRDDVAFDRAPVIALAATDLAVDVVRLLGAMVRSAQMAGALGYLLTQSVRYAGERVQFGRPIGRFQAIQQELARLAGEAAASQVAAEVAFAAAGRAAPEPGAWRDGSDPTFEIAVAKVRLGEAAEIAPGIAHQVHGAIGFTYEHALHFATRRLWSWRAEFGSANVWARLLGHRAIALGADGLWPDLTSR